MKKARIDYKKLDNKLKDIESHEKGQKKIYMVDGRTYTLPDEAGRAITAQASEEQLRMMREYLLRVEEEGEDETGEYWGYWDVFQWYYSELEKLLKENDLK